MERNDYIGLIAEIYEQARKDYIAGYVKGNPSRYENVEDVKKFVISNPYGITYDAKDILATWEKEAKFEKWKRNLVKNMKKKHGEEVNIRENVLYSSYRRNDNTILINNLYKEFLKQEM